ncbi:hypothetical protein VTK56DRAFT_653 [Thermocarpiscus australiensis]
MPVTEFAILRLKATPPDNEVHDLLTSAMRLQDEWHAAHFPGLPSSASDRAAAWFEQIEDPTQILTTAKWASVAAHWDWIRSDANTGVMAALDGHIVAGDTVLFHVDADIFGGGPEAAGNAPSGSVPLLQSPVISVSRMFVASRDKEAFAALFGEVRGVLEEYASPGSVGFGWREDLEARAEEEEFVVVCGWESVEKHLGFARAPGYSRFNEIQQFVARADIKHYKRFL